MLAQLIIKTKRLLKIDFVRFCIVGGTGFVINFIILDILHRVFNVPIFVAQLIGAEISLFCNFMLHHHWTYKAHKVKKSMGRLLIQFHATSWPATLGSALMVTGGEKFLHLADIWALAVSSSIVLAWNFFWSKYIIWRDVTEPDIERIVT